MGSTFSGIELGKRSIMANTDAIQTAGHNISNASTEGYSRQRVQVKEFDPLYHQSVSMRKDETKESGIVLEVFQKGYTYKDKVLRPAMVIINE